MFAVYPDLRKEIVEPFDRGQWCHRPPFNAELPPFTGRFEKVEIEEVEIL